MNDGPERAREKVTRLLVSAEAGDGEALRRLVPLIYDDLKRLARRQRRSVRADRSDTLDTTGLVHEAFVKLVDRSRVRWDSQAHFFNLASQAMRQIIVDYARERRAQKRGGGQRPDPLSESVVQDEGGRSAELVIAVDAALEKLGEIDARLVRLVECRFFAGLTDQETADTLGVSARTVQRDWARARAWLHDAMQAGG
jgi:RNA polymerase sigma factor (TIGR02999 family)